MLHLNRFQQLPKQLVLQMILETVQFVKRLSQLQQHVLGIVVTHFTQPVFQNGLLEVSIAQTVDMIFVSGHLMKNHQLWLYHVHLQYSGGGGE